MGMIQRVACSPGQVSLGPLCYTSLRVAVVFPQVWNQTEPAPAAAHLLSLCFLKTAGVWVPPMYLWVLGPIHLLYIHRHDKGYLQMSALFKAKMVAAAPGSLSPDYGRGVGGAGRDLKLDTPSIKGHIRWGQEGNLLIKQKETPETTEVKAIE